jgi:hypothetical protein
VFFQEWLRVETNRQERIKFEKKQAKLAKRAAKLERRKKREIEVTASRKNTVLDEEAGAISAGS